MSKVTLNDLIIPKHDEVLFDILDHKHTHYTFYGGRGGVKSSFIGVAIILLITQNPQAHAVVCRKVAATLRDSVYAQINFAIGLLGMESLFKCTTSPMEITYKPTNQKILFRGLDTPEKLKSIKMPFGYIGVTWFEEVDQMAGRAEIRKVLQSTMRGKDGMFWNFESFNPPVSNQNWANKDLYEHRPDRLCVQTSYLDVPREWLSEQFYSEAEFLKEVNYKAYEHEYLGIATGTGGTVFGNVTIRTIADDEISVFDRIYCGLDWGFFPDPNHFSQMYFNAAQRKLYIFGEIRKWKTSNKAMAEELEGYKYTRNTAYNSGEKQRITADSSEQKSISDFYTYGFDMRAAIKGPGSVDYSMKWLASLSEIIIDPQRCPYTKDEFLGYELERTKDGLSFISGYPDKDNHAIDSVRYALEEIWKRQGR